MATLATRLGARGRVGCVAMRATERRPVAAGARMRPRRGRGDGTSARARAAVREASVERDGSIAATIERSINSALIALAVGVIDELYAGRSYARFHALETVARVPYFSFMSVLHLYETFGWWRRADYLKVHFAETMNEYHHLLIMESLGGAELWKDRFFAQHVAVAYYWICVFQYLISPRWAYNLLEQVESHAYATYDKFLDANEEVLKKTPAPRVAVAYYTKGDLYLFDEFQTGEKGARRPKIDNLYDVFVNVRNDEAEHMKTMEFCQRPGNGLRSPSTKEALGAMNDDCDDEVCESAVEGELDGRSCEGLVDCVVNFGTGAVSTYDPEDTKTR